MDLQKLKSKVLEGRKLGNYYQFIVSEDNYLVLDIRCGLLALWKGNRSYTFNEGFSGELVCVLSVGDIVYEEEKLKELYDLQL